MVKGSRRYTMPAKSDVLDIPNRCLSSYRVDTVARPSDRRVLASTSHGRRFKTLFHQRFTRHVGLLPAKPDGLDIPNRYLFSYEVDIVARSSYRRVLSSTSHGRRFQAVFLQ
ncbi:hypothetical protein AVEN_72528-1 [Araneus ventricosus]|uniref:Uncharacterized protein n=1 Tax=Araneus ventricosus TaxID=182803 RepID=A0A4Y2TY43_ARAVE|nr:hypothetical protein AVEN_72528-1 [Araneus ventricosus]